MINSAFILQVTKRFAIISHRTNSSFSCRRISHSETLEKQIYSATKKIEKALVQKKVRKNFYHNFCWGNEICVNKFNKYNRYHVY